VSSAVTRDWQNIDPSDGRKGQYRLVDYTYTSGVGTLTVEGRIDQQGVGRGPSTTRVEVTIPIASGSGSSSTNPVGIPGLWTQSFTLDNINVPLATNIIDASGCVSGSTSFANANLNYQLLKNIPISPLPTSAPYPLSSTPGTVTVKNLAFPPLPGGTYTGQIATFPAANFNNKSCITIGDNTNITFPQAGDIFTDETGATQLGTYNSSDAATAPSQSGTYIYRISNCYGASISLNNTGGIRFGTSANQTFIIFLDGSLTTANTGTVSAYASGGNNAALIIYSNGNINLNNAAALAPPEKMQIYNYGANNIVLANTGDIRGFLFAPQSNVRSDNAGSFIGAVWSKSYTAANYGGVYQANIDTSKLKIPMTVSVTTNKLGNISSWSRKQVN
jgi:hypothetical protein